MRGATISDKRNYLRADLIHRQASAELEKVDAAMAFYEQKVRPELLASKIVPVLLAIGEKLPYIGRPAALPVH